MEDHRIPNFVPGPPEGGGLGGNPFTMQTDPHVIFMLGTISTKIDAQTARLDRFLRDQEKHDERITSLEQGRYKQIGFFSAIAAVLSVAGIKLQEYLF